VLLIALTIVFVAGQSIATAEARDVDHVVVNFTNTSGSSDGAYLVAGTTYDIEAMRNTSINITIYNANPSSPPFKYYVMDTGNGLQHSDYSSNSNYTFYDIVGPNDSAVQAYVDILAGMVTANISWYDPPAEIQVDDSVIDFGTSSTSEDLDIRNSGGGSLNYSLSADVGWVSDIYPTLGSSSGSWSTHEITIDRSGESPGNHSGKIYINSNVGTESVTIQMSVPLPPSPPVASIVIPVSSSPTFDFGEFVHFEARGTDSGGDLEGCQWSVSGASSGGYTDNWSGTSGNRVSGLDWDFVSAGVHYVQARFYDTAGLAATANWQITVRSAPEPVLDPIGYAPEILYVDEYFDVIVEGRNAGETVASKGGIAIQVRNASTGSVVVTANPSFDDQLKHVWSAGETLGTGHDAEYLHIEPMWYNWQPGATHMNSSRISGLPEGTYDLYAKMYLSLDGISTAWRDPGGSTLNEDHQYESTVHLGTVAVIQPLAYVSSCEANRADGVAGNHVTLSSHAFSRGYYDRFATLTDVDQFNSCMQFVREGLWVKAGITNQGSASAVAQLRVRLRYPDGSVHDIPASQSFWGWEGWLANIAPNSTEYRNIPIFPNVGDPIDEGEYELFLRFEEDFDMNSPDLIIQVDDQPLAPPASIHHGTSTAINFDQYTTPPDGKDLFEAAIGLFNIICQLKYPDLTILDNYDSPDDMFGDVRAAFLDACETEVEISAQTYNETSINTRFRSKTVTTALPETHAIPFDRATCVLDIVAPPSGQYARSSILNLPLMP